MLNGKKVKSIRSKISMSALRFKDLVAAIVQRDTWRSAPPCDVLLVRHDADCGYTHRGLAYSQILDSFSDLCTARGLSTVTVAHPYSRLLGAAAYGNCVSFNRGAFRVALAARLRRFAGGAGASPISAEAQRREIWGGILRQCRPACVVAIGTSGDLCAAAHAAGIPIYDFQHGLISEAHPEYGARFLTKRPVDTLPTGYLCWDEASADVLRQGASSPEPDVRVVGNPWFQRFLVPRPNDALVTEAAQAIKGVAGRPSVLVSLAWGMDIIYGPEHIDTVITKRLEQAILQTADRYNWLLRLHPVQLRGKERQWVESTLRRTFGGLQSVDWEVCSRLPLPVVLSKADAHVSDYSSVTIEAAWFGVPSALLHSQFLDPDHPDTPFKAELASGLAHAVGGDADAIIAWLARNIAEGRRPNHQLVSDDAVQDFIENVCRRDH